MGVEHGGEESISRLERGWFKWQQHHANFLSPFPVPILDMHHTGSSRCSRPAQAYPGAIGINVPISLGGLQGLKLPHKIVMQVVVLDWAANYEKIIPMLLQYTNQTSVKSINP